MTFISVSCIFLLLFDISFEYTTVAMLLTYSYLFNDEVNDVLFFMSNVERDLISMERIR